MDAKNATIAGILQDATGNRASGRELLVRPKQTYLTPDAAAVLREQWNSAGRDNAFVVMMLSEADGSNPHLVTGWDGKDTFVCYTDQGLTYVDQRKLERLRAEERWDPTTRLVEVRAHQITEDDDGLSGAEVDMLVKRIKKTLKKSSKKRRKGRLRNMEKFFNFAVVESEGPESETEFERIKEKDDRVPEAPKEPSTQKLPKDAKSKQTHRESLSWDVLGSDGRPRMRGLRHPMMNENATDPQLDKREHVRQDSEGKGGSGGATLGGNKTDPQQDKRERVTMRHEQNATQPQLDRREHVRMDGEGKGGGAGATPGGNKTDPQKEKREHVAMRHEEKALGAGDKSDKSDELDHLNYAGEKVTDKEFGSRPKIAVRHEAVGDKKAKKLFGPGAPKKSPLGAKKPLLMLVLMTKGKKAPKRPMAESEVYCPRHGGSTKVGRGPIGMMRGLMRKPEPSKPGEPVRENCPTCAKMRRKGGGGLTLNVEMPRKPKSAFESRFGRSRLNLVEAKKKVPESFLANIEKMKAKAKARKGKGCY